MFSTNFVQFFSKKSFLLKKDASINLACIKEEKKFYLDFCIIFNRQMGKPEKSHN